MPKTSGKILKMQQLKTQTTIHTKGLRLKRHSKKCHNPKKYNTKNHAYMYNIMTRKNLKL